MRRTGLLAILAVLLSSAPATAASPSPRLIYQPPLSAGTIDAVDLKALARQLIQLLEKHHLEADPADPQFGMLYETKHVPSNRWIEGEARDTMHHMMWCINGMTIAYRATQDRAISDFMLKYPYAFYLRVMLNSDKYFPGHNKGFLPYWWDDGDSYDLPSWLKGQEKKLNGHSANSSIHMAQDIAVTSLNAWWLTRDPRLALAADYLSKETQVGAVAARNVETILKKNPTADRAALLKVQATRMAPVVAAAKAEMNGERVGKKHGRTAEPPTTTTLSSALRLRKNLKPSAVPDEIAFAYLCVQTGHWVQSLDEAYARQFTAELLARPLLEQYWFDDSPYRHGDMFFPGASANHVLENGKYVTYRSDVGSHLLHTRGYHYAWLSGVGLQMLENFPDLHESYRRQVAADDVVVRFVDATPALDGNGEADYSEATTIGAARLRLLSDPLSLFVLLQTNGPIELKIFETEQAGEHFAVIHVTADGNVTVKNWQGKELVFWSAQGQDGVEVQIPYMIYKPQGDWLTGVEHGRYRLQIGDAAKVVYMLSTQQRMKKRLQEQVEGTICNAKAWIDKLGYIPYTPNDKSTNPRHALSFSGAYGHMLAVIGEYLLWKSGKADWEVKDKVRLEVN